MRDPQPVSLPPSAPSSEPSPFVALTPFAGNSAALTLLVCQQGLSFVLMRYMSMGLAMFLTFLGTIAVLWLLFPKALQAVRHDTRWTKPLTVRMVALTVGAFLVAFVVSRLFSTAALFLLPSQNLTAPTQFLSTGLDQVLVLLTGGLLIPFAEELAFRGLLMRGHERVLGFGWAAVTSSVVFALGHQTPVQVIAILPLAYALARVIQYTGSFWSGVIVHALNNSFSLVMLWFLSLQDQAAVTDSLGQTQGLMNTLSEKGLRLPVGLAMLLFGGAAFWIMHLWLRPQPDPVVLAKGEPKKPWLNEAFIFLFALGMVAFLAWLLIPEQVKSFFTQLRT